MGQTHPTVADVIAGVDMTTTKSAKVSGVSFVAVVSIASICYVCV